MDETPFLSHFSPQWTRPEALEQILVQRESLLSDSVEKIRESIVTGNKLGSMGDPVTKVYGNQEVKFCCKPCVAKYEKNPGKYASNIR